MYFSDEEIFVDELKIMRPENCFDFIKQFKKGVQINFQYHLQKWQEINNYNQHGFKNVQQQTYPINTIPIDNNGGMKTINVLEIINNHNDGAFLKSHFVQENKFEDGHRHLLCNILIDYFLTKRSEKNLSTDECDVISSQIVQLFPGELKVSNFVQVLFQLDYNLCYIFF